MIHEDHVERDPEPAPDQLHAPGPRPEQVAAADRPDGPAHGRRDPAGRPAGTGSLRNVVRLIHCLGGEEGLADKVRVVINRAGADTVEEGISLKKAEEVIGKPIFWQVPNDPKAVIGARVAGAPAGQARPEEPRAAEHRRAGPGALRQAGRRGPTLAEARAAGASSASAEPTVATASPSVIADTRRTNDHGATDEHGFNKGISKLNSLSNHGEQHLAAVQPEHGRQHRRAAARASTSSSGGFTASWSTSSTCRASATCERRAAPRDPPRRRAPVRHRKHAAQPQRARAADRRSARRDVRPRPARDAAQGPDDQRHPDQRPEERLRRTPRQAGKDRRQVPRQRAPDADHRPHRVEGRPARRRSLPDGATPACRTAPASTPIIPPLALDGAERVAFAASAPTRSSSKTC